VGSEAQRVNVQIAKVHGQFSDQLDGIGVQKRTVATAKLSGRSYRLEHAGFMVSEHDAHEASRRPEQLF
jgi:hypothetical protein